MGKAQCILAVLIALLLPACEKAPQRSENLEQGPGPERARPALVTANEETLVTVEEFERMMDSLRGQKKRKVISEAERRQLLEERIDEALLLREAHKRRVDRDAELLEKVERYRKKLIKEKLYRQLADEKIQISEEEIHQHYEDFKHRFVEQEQIRVNQILLLVPRDADEQKKREVKERAAELLKRARTGENFSELIQQYSEGPNKSRNGDLGYFTKGRMFPAFEKAAFSLREIGEISDLVTTNFGYHIVKLVDRKPERQLPLEEVRSRILSRLKPAKERKFRQNLPKILREEVEITIHEDRLRGQNTRSSNSGGSRFACNSPAPHDGSCGTCRRSSF